jgi:4-amino-4-deoxy-L-arabinose transferase-like glycosyltransferase
MESASKAAEVASVTDKTAPLQAGAATQSSNDAPTVLAPAQTKPQLTRYVMPALIVLIGFATCVVPIAAAGLWDPVEVEVADLARRAAVHVMNASTLSPEGTTDLVPTVEEVGRGELPLLSMALGLKVFGAHAWALRLPLALWTAIGAAALYWLVARLENRRAAWLSVLVLVTSPVVFVNARTALGDAVTMASIALGFAGLLLAWADPAFSARARAAAFVVGGLGLTAGFFSRGLLLGVAVPALAAGATWAVMRGNDETPAPNARQASVYGLVTLVLGLGASVWGGWALYSAGPEVYSKLIGATISDPKQMPTHDVVIHYLGHGLFPWSALLPLAIGALFRHVSGPRMALRAGLALAIGFGVLFYSLVISRTGLIAFGSTFAVAACCALAMLALDYNRRGVLPLMVCTALLVLLYKDFENFPEKGMSAFAWADAGAFPDAMKSVTKRYLRASVALGLLTCVLVVVGRIQWSDLVTTLQSSDRRVAKLTVVVLGKALGLTHTIAQRVSARVKRPRGFALAASLAIGGLVLSVGYYPALAAQLSPAGVYSAYSRLASADEPLAVMGDGAVKGSLFYAAGPLKSFKSLEGAVDWLGAPSEPRRWLILKNTDLARANARFREKNHTNLPILNADSSEILLASNTLAGDKSQSPLDAVVSTQAPALRHTPKATWGDELELAGWELRLLGQDEPTDTIIPGKTYSFITAYRVLKDVNGSWESFIHIDGNGKRINGDHQLTGNKYPLRNWSPGDIIIDNFELKVDPTYDSGEYNVFLGLYSGNKRYKLTAGEGTDDRLAAGVVRVAR